MDLIETLNAVKFLIEAIGGGFIAFCLYKLITMKEDNN